MKLRKLFVIVSIAVGILSAQSLKMAVANPVKAKRCLEEGKRLEARAAPEGPGHVKLFEIALQKYLCAAKAGSAEGALSAASLSLSGMAPQLVEDTLKGLYILAIDSGRLEGYSGMAEIACGADGFFNCTKNPQSAITWLRKGGIDNFQDIVTQILANPNISVSDSSIAYACLKRLRGKHVQDIRMQMIKLNPRLDTTQTCEVKP
jgi:hypothetical protein